MSKASALLAMLLAMFAMLAPAQARAQDGFSLTVSPTRIELASYPGKSVTATVSLENSSAGELVFQSQAVDFEPGFLGQLGMYMAAVDDLLAHTDDKPTIGLLLCRSKNNVVAEYALRGYSTPIGVAEWTTAITTALPAEFTSSLPSIAELEAELSEPPISAADTTTTGER